MNKTAIQKFAIEGHDLLYKQISQRAYQYGVEENSIGDIDAADVRGNLLTSLEKSQRVALIKAVAAEGYQHTIERVTYIWFNRIVALRFMEVNNYLPSHIRVFSDDAGAFKPEILNDVLHLEMNGLDKAQVAEYIEENKTEELYRYLLLTQCAELKVALPDIFVFDKREFDYTELLFPNNVLTGNDSFIAKMLRDTKDNDWTDAVEIIGWLYQYYNDKRKNEVINIYKGTVKKVDIPAATQLFTTDWVVRYMVDNSLGRYWIERHPESKLADKLEFFVTSKNGEITHIDEFVKPEDIKFLDPCMGSGHVLVYAFDVLLEIYKESGYSERDAVSLIVQNNLFGLDIDERASQLAYFAVMMKARSYDRRFLTHKIQPNVFVIQESNLMEVDERRGNIGAYLMDTFRDAKELGSIITVEPKDYDGYIDYLNSCDGDGQLGFEDSKWLDHTRPDLQALAEQAKVLSAKYNVVCTNPPYLNKMEGALKKAVTRDYKDYSGDLFSVFTYRNLMFCEQDGYCGYMTPFVWMFIKTYEKLREFIIRNKSITTLVQMEYSAFEEATVPICSFVLKNGKTMENGLYFKLSDFKGGMEVQKQKVLEALADKNCGYFYEADQSNFSKIPGSPVAYWASRQLVYDFQNGVLLGNVAKPRQGMATTNNNLFLRLWSEVNCHSMFLHAMNKEEALNSRCKWFPYNKGGDFRKWYGNNDYLVNWENDGADIKRYLIGKNPNIPRGESLYFKECFSWSLISSAEPAFRYKAPGNIFDIAGMSCFSDDRLYYLMALCNSKVALSALRILAPTINFQAGDIAYIPVLEERDMEGQVAEIAEKNVRLSRDDWDSYETSWDFKRNPLV